jgi:hypothetical protein
LLTAVPARTVGGSVSRRREHMSRMISIIALSVMLVLAAAVGIMKAEPAIGVTANLIGRGSYLPFRVKSHPHSLVDFDANAKSPVDIVIREHTYQPGGSTGWHTHPGPVFITVLEGTLTFYEYDDPTCTPRVVWAPYGYVDTGRGHIARNETGQSAKDVSVILAPWGGGAFREELPAPGPHCGF